VERSATPRPRDRRPRSPDRGRRELDGRHASARPPLIDVYPDDEGRLYAAHRDWRKNQYVNRPSASKLPSLPHERADSGAVLESSVNTHGASTEPHVPSESESDDRNRCPESNNLASFGGAREGVTSQNAADALEDDDLDLPDRPEPASDAAEFVGWFWMQGIERGAISAHEKLDISRRVRDPYEISAAARLVDAYGEDVVREQAVRMFNRKIDLRRKLGPLRVRISVATLDERRSWFLAEPVARHLLATAQTTASS
jgi:hypothetical protein